MTDSLALPSTAYVREGSASSFPTDTTAALKACTAECTACAEVFSCKHFVIQVFSGPVDVTAQIDWTERNQ